MDLGLNWFNDMCSNGSSRPIVAYGYREHVLLIQVLGRGAFPGIGGTKFTKEDKCIVSPMCFQVVDQGGVNYSFLSCQRYKWSKQQKDIFKDDVKQVKLVIIMFIFFSAIRLMNNPTVGVLTSKKEVGFVLGGVCM